MNLICLKMLISSFVCLQVLFPSFANSSAIRAYSVFDRDQRNFHKYSAILAASEPQRVIRDEEVKKVLSPMTFWLSQLLGGLKDLNSPSSKLRSKNSIIDAICEDYEKRLLEMVHSYGLDADEFNEIGKQVNSSPALKQKIMQQVFHYKLAADLDSNLAVNVKSIPSKSEVKAVSGSDNLERFSKALQKIEKDRLEVRRGLMVFKAVSPYSS